MAGFRNDVVFGTNVDFTTTGLGSGTGTMLLDGQLLIASTALNAGGTHINVNTLTAGSGISIINGPGTITIVNTGGGGGGGGTNTLVGNVGSATQVLGVINVPATTGINTVGLGNTLTVSPANDLAAVEALTGTGFAARTGVETWALRTLQAGTGISITNPAGIAGDPTISSTGISWIDQSGAFAAAADTGYFLTAAATATLPGSPNQGDEIRFSVDTTGTVTITANTGQFIRFGAQLSAVAGTCVNTHRGDTINLVYRASGATWHAQSGNGTWLIT